MKALVTGGKGFIGSHLVNFLKAKGFWVRSVDYKSGSYLKTLEDEFLELDLRMFEHAEKAVKDIDWVFNLAADMGGIGYITEFNASIMRNNSLININMLDASRLANVSRYFFSSSACIYPRELQTVPNLTPLKESDDIPAHPDSAYGWEKLYAELLCQSFMHDYGLPVRIGRYHNIYGTHTTYKGGQEKAPAALCRKVAEAKNGEYIVVWGDGKQTRSFTWIDDCIEGTYLLTKSTYEKPVNVGTNELVTIDQLAEIIIKISGKKLGIIHDLTKPQGVRGRNADYSLAQTVLGWQPKIDLETGLTRLYMWIDGQINKEIEI